MQYIKPELEYIHFALQDVILTSEEDETPIIPLEEEEEFEDF